MKYAVISVSGRQFKVAEGDTLEIDKATTFSPRVLLYSDEGKVTVGNPFLEDIEIKGKIQETKKGKKITIRRFKAKSRYHKTVGFRPSLTLVKIDFVGRKGEERKSETHVEAKAKPAPKAQEAKAKKASKKGSKSK